MITVPTLRLATCRDAPRIAQLSRDRIEQGLGWSWTAPRVERSIADAETNVLVAADAGRLLGFGIMSYGDDDSAHLVLLAVAADSDRRGIGGAMLGWLEQAARTAGTAHIGLEARVTNAAARAFYARLGYVEVQELPGYYRGREACVRLTKDLGWGREGVD